MPFFILRGDCLKVVFRFDAGEALQRRVAALSDADFDITCCPESSDERYEALLPEAEVLWHVLKAVSAEQIARAPQLKLVQKIGVGVNTIALDACRARGIAVCNLPGTNSRAVAEMSLLLMLACLRRLTELDRAVRQPQGWAEGWRLQERFGELGGRTVGLVGYGAVARLLETMLAAMGVRVIHWSRSSGGALNELLAQSDIVSLPVPLTADTTHLIDPRQMKRGSILINTARGPLVDPALLFEALQSGHLGAAGLDVFAEEPVAANDPLLALPNVICTPHLAWLTPETLQRSLVIATDNVRRLIRGEDLLHRVV